MNTIKNAHSPAGMGYSLAGTRYAKLKDCPKCKYGTIDLRIIYRNAVEVDRFWQCADCGARFKPEEIK
jgi:hypothetical protein